MQLSATSPAVPVAPATPAPAGATPVADPRAGTGVQGVVGDIIRGAGSGYEQATKMTGVQADKAAIYPFETVSTATGLLKAKTANIKFVNKGTGMLHTIGGFALLIMLSNASGILKSPGVTGNELAHKLADVIDGQQTAQGFTPGWFMTPPSDSSTVQAPPESGVGSVLSSLGMK